MKGIKHITILWGTIILLIYSTSIGIRHVFRYNGFKLEIASVEASLQEAKKINQRNKRQLTAMTHPGFWELQIKQRLGYVRNGEKVIKGYVK